MKSLLLFISCLLLGQGISAGDTLLVLGEIATESVTRTSSPIGDTGFSFSELDSAALQRTPNRPVDDLLRQVPNFSLFRRSSSAVSNPTTQGASLRGIGPSGTSRSLLLYDGIPLNDAFGGWIPWSQINTDALQRIEVVRGGGSPAWGNTAIGGVIQLVPSEVGSVGKRISGAFGSQGLRTLSFMSGERKEDWAWELSGRLLNDDGYVRVSPSQAGAVDIPASASHEQIELRGQMRLGPERGAGLRLMYFNEDRGNGTPLTLNSTENWLVHLKTRPSSRSVFENDSNWTADFYFGQGSYASTFSSVTTDRSSENLVLDQFSVPSDFGGGSFQFFGELSDQLFYKTGFDFRFVEGETNERVIFAGANRRAGARQFLTGVFLMADWEQETAGNLHFGARLDRWDLQRAFLQQPNQESTNFENRNEIIPSLRLGWGREVVRNFKLRGAVYQAFRVPTVNELVRPFQVGADLTQANPELEPERLLGFEFGADWNLQPGLVWRNTVFQNEVKDPILNLTIGESATGGQLRQRRNIDKTRIRGWESDLIFRREDGWFSQLGLALTDARVREASEAPDLEGARLAQVARVNLSAAAGYQPPLEGPGFNLTARWLGAQFEDDRNQRRLGGGLVMDMDLYYKLNPDQRVWLGVTNLTDRRLADGITGADLVTLTAPRRGLIGFSSRF